MRKIILFALVVLVALSICSCNTSGSQESNEPSGVTPEGVKNQIVEIIGDNVVKKQDIANMSWEYRFKFEGDTLSTIELTITTASEKINRGAVVAMQNIGFETVADDGNRITMKANDDLLKSYEGAASTKQEFYNLLNNQ